MENSYNYTDGKSPFWAAKIQNYLSKKVRYENKIITRAKFIADRLLEEHIPECKDNVFRYYRGRETKPKTEYYLVKNDRAYRLSKTEYDFALYLYESGAVTPEKQKELIAEEARHKQALEEEKLIKSQQEQKRLQEMRDYEKWITEEANQYYEENDPRINRMIPIYEERGLQFYPAFAKILVLMDHYDHPLSNMHLKQILHRENKASLKAFEAVTGICLGTTNQQINKVLDSISKKDLVEKN